MLLGTASAFLVLAGLHLTAWLVGPVFLALIVVVAISPVQARLRRRGWPDWLSTLVLVLLVVGLMVALALVFVVSIARLGALLPQYTDRADEIAQAVAGSLEGLGVGRDQLQEAVSAVDLSKVIALVGVVLAGLSGAVSSLVFLLCLLFFLSLESAGMDQRLAATAVDRPGLARALRSFAGGTRTYLVVAAVFGLIVAVLDGVALAIIGIPLPVLWAALSFITNFVPNIGFVLGLVPPALLGLLTGGVPEMLLVVVVYSVLNFVIQSLIQPRFVGDSVGLSVTVSFLALVFWTWLLGPLGAVLAIPLTVLVKALLIDVDPTARWAIALGGTLERQPRAPRTASRRRHRRPVVPAAGAATGTAAADGSPVHAVTPGG